MSRKTYCIGSICYPMNTWSKLFNISKSTLYYRLRRGLSLIEAICYTDPRINNLNGQTFGELTVISNPILKPKTNGRNSSWFLCQCSCGKQKEISGNSLLKGHTKTCGKCKIVNFKHGHSNKSGKNDASPTYRSWVSAKRRTQVKPDDEKYRVYKNVSMCSEWLNSFETFLADMGERPPGTTLDRYPDKKGNYEPSNCRWGTPKQQSNNKTNNKLITFQGKTQTLQEWSEEIGMNKTTLRARIYKRGWTIAEALTIPVGTQRKKAVA